MASHYDKLLCPICKEIPKFSNTSARGSITKCVTDTCEGADRWVSPEEWEDFQQQHEVQHNV